MKLKIYIHMVLQKNIHVKIIKQSKSTIKSLFNLKKKFKYSRSKNKISCLNIFFKFLDLVNKIKKENYF